MTHDAAVALILALCRSQPDDAAQAEIADLLTRPLDWDKIAELAALHGVVGLVRRNLLAMQAEDQVPAAWKAIEAAATQVAFDGVLQLRETDLITATLHEAGIEAILLKGMALGDPLRGPTGATLRRHRPAGYARRIWLMPRRCWPRPAICHSRRPSGPSSRPTATTSAWCGSPCRATTRCLSYTGTWVRATCFATTWPPGAAAHSGFHWQYATPLLRFSPEDQLLHLALHMRKHRYVGLRWLVDVAELLRRFGDSLNWPYVTTVAEQAGLRTLLYTTVTLAGQLLGSVCLRSMAGTIGAVTSSAAAVALRSDAGRVRRWRPRRKAGPVWPRPRCCCWTKRRDGPRAALSPDAAPRKAGRLRCRRDRPCRPIHALQSQTGPPHIDAAAAAR